MPVHGLGITVGEGAGCGLGIVTCHGVELVFCEEEKFEHGGGELRRWNAAFDVYYGSDVKAHLGDFSCESGVALCWSHLYNFCRWMCVFDVYVEY